MCNLTKDLMEARNQGRSTECISTKEWRQTPNETSKYTQTETIRMSAIAYASSAMT